MLAIVAKSFTRTSLPVSARLYSTPPSSVQHRIDHHVIHQFGYPKEGATHGYEPEFVMVRTLQRYPNASVKENLFRLHAKMAKKFLAMSDESLDWLLGGARLASMGGFQTPQELRQFLCTDPAVFTSAQLITQLEPVLTSIGYRAKNIPAAELPALPETPAQHEMYKVIMSIVDGQLVPPISKLYPHKVTDWVPEINKDTVMDELIICEHDDELSDDEDNLFRGLPGKSIPDAYYKAVGADGKSSWMAQAREQGVYVRRHVSGTAPMCMAAIVGLLAPEDGTSASPFTSEQEARDLFTALFIPKYLRADYHSIAETHEGINYFVAENASVQFDGCQAAVPVSPHEAQERAYEAICMATCDEHKEFGVTPRQAMRDYQSCIAIQKQQKKTDQVTNDAAPMLLMNDDAMIALRREVVMKQVKVVEKKPSDGWAE